MFEDLTSRQREVLKHIRQSIERRGYPPSVSELMGCLGSVSPNGVMCHLKALTKKGYIERDRKLARGIRLTDQAKQTGIPLVNLESVAPSDKAVW